MTSRRSIGSYSDFSNVHFDTWWSRSPTTARDASRGGGCADADVAQGVVLGRPRVLDEAVRARIRSMREDGASLARIADTLTEDGTPTAHNGRR